MRGSFLWAGGRRPAASGAAVAVLLVTGALGAAAGQAAPGSDATIVATPFSVPDGSIAAPTAACPAGMRAIGGGVNTTGPASQPNSPYSYLLELSGPQDESGLTAETNSGDVARYWYGAILNLSYDEQLFKTFAICSRSSDATIVAMPFNVPADSSGAATAACPAGTRVVGGGVNTTGPAPGPTVAYSVQLSGPQDENGLTATTKTGDVARYWYASVYNSSGAQQLFKTFAICSRSSDATVVAASYSVPNMSPVAPTAACPAGTRALGGGVNTTGPAPPANSFYYIVQLSGPLDEDGLTATTNTGDVARYWYSSIYNASGAPQLFKTFALCAKDPVGSGGGGGGGGGGGSGSKCAGRTATIVGTAGANKLEGTPGPDVIVGLGGKDKLSGRGGNDRICGGAGKDRIKGGPGTDRLFGQGGKDVLRGGPGRDRIKGGPGKDKEKQ